MFPFSCYSRGQSLAGRILDWHSSKFSGVNVSRLLGDDQSKGAGRKGRVAKRKRPIRPSRTGTKQCILQPIATSAATATDISSQSNDEVGRSRSTNHVRKDSSDRSRLYYPSPQKRMLLFSTSASRERLMLIRTFTNS